MGGPHTKIRRHSRVETELTPEIKAQVDRLLIENATYEEISEFLKKQGHDISRSSIGRYGKDFLNAYKRLRMIEDQSRTLVSEAGQGMVLEEAASKIFSQQIIEMLLDAGMEPKSLPKLAMAFSMLQSSSVSREKFKADLKKKVGRAIEQIEQGMKKMTKEEMVQLMKESYGLL